MSAVFFYALQQASQRPNNYALLWDASLTRQYQTETKIPDYRPERDQLYSSLTSWSNVRFRREYRMNKDCFELLVQNLRECPSGKRNLPAPGEDFVNQNALPPAHRVLIALRYLATPDLISSLALTFNVARSTIHECVTDVCNLILEMENSYINWPTREQMEIEEATLFSRYGFPGCFGCLDGTQINIQKPQTDPEVYFNRKKDYSLNTLLVCNSAEEIIYYTVGSPGSYHDARVYRRSTLPDLLSAVPSEYHLLGDSAYPLSTAIMKPFAESSNNPPAYIAYNKAVTSTRSLTENANARLKNKWQRLKRIQTTSVARARLIIRACLVLHNFVLKHDSDIVKVDRGRPIAAMPRGDDETSKRQAIANFINRMV